MRVLNLPSIQTLTVDFTNHAYKDCWFWGRFMVNVTEFFANSNAFWNECAEMLEDVELYGGVYVETELYSPLMEALPHNFDPNEEGGFAYYVDDISGNYVVHRVSLSKPDDPYSLNGVRMEFLECGYFDVESYDALIRDCCVPPEADREEQ